MKTTINKLIAVSLLLVANYAQAQGGAMGGGGGDFNYMRSLEALRESEFNTILSDKGSAFMKSVIAPASWVGYQYLFQNQIKDKIKSDHASTEIWNSLLKDGFESLWDKINSTSLESCSCEDVRENESTDNQICAKTDPISKINRVCIDLRKIFDAKRPLNIDYHLLIGAIWHELAHLYSPTTDHKLMYQFGVKIKNQSMLNQLRTSYDREPKAKTCILNGEATSVSFDTCIEKAITLSRKKNVKLKFESKEPYEQITGKVKNRNTEEASDLICELTRSDSQFPNQLLTERKSDFYDWYAYLSFYQDFLRPTSAGSIGYGIYMGTFKDASVWTVSFPVTKVKTCLYAFEHGFDKLTIRDSQGLYLKLK